MEKKGRIRIVLASVLIAAGAQADLITNNGVVVNMEFVSIGYPGNVADAITTYGAVGYNYRIGTYEVTADQWKLVHDADSRIGLSSSATGDRPENRKDWFEIARFANWLTSGDPYKGAYQFNDSGGFIAIDRDAAQQNYDTVYAMPTENEWYKAAYLKSDGSGYTIYPTGDTVPVATKGPPIRLDAIFDLGRVGLVPGIESVAGVEVTYVTDARENNGTHHMGGNVQELLENRVVRGGSFAELDASNLSRLARAGPVPFAETRGGNFRGFRLVALDSQETPAPELTIQFIESSRAVVVEWTAVGNAAYQVQYSTNLPLASWLDLGTVNAPGNSFTNAVDSEDAARFYRVLAE